MKTNWRNKVFPLKKLPRRACHRLSNFLKLRVLRFRNRVGLTATVVNGSTPEGNESLSFKKTTRLGDRGSELHLPKDDKIYRSVQLQGQWSWKESKFLASGLKQCCRSSATGVALLDIGAHCGLISLQSLRTLKTLPEVVMLFEPIPQHASAIRFNLEPFTQLSRVEVFDFALGREDQEATIYVRDTNRGNSSLIPPRDELHGARELRVSVVDAEKFFCQRSEQFDRLVIKCDSEGLDAAILSRLPSNLWAKVERAVVEVSALPEIDESEVRTFLGLIGESHELSWSPRFRPSISPGEVYGYWMSCTGMFQNLFIRRRSYS